MGLILLAASQELTLTERWALLLHEQIPNEVSKKLKITTGTKYRLAFISSKL